MTPGSPRMRDIPVTAASAQANDSKRLQAASIPLVGWLVGVGAVIYGIGVVAFALPWKRPTTPQTAAPLVPAAGVMRPTPSAG